MRSFINRLVRLVDRTEAAPGLQWKHLRSAARRRNAAAIYVRALEQGPVLHDAAHDEWIVLGNKEVWNCLKARDLYRSQPQVSFDAVLKGDDLKADARIRRMIVAGIARVSAERCEHFVEQWLARFTDRLGTAHRFDAVADLAVPLSDDYAAAVLGLGDDDKRRLAGLRKTNRTDIGGVQPGVASIFAEILQREETRHGEGFCSDVARARAGGEVPAEEAVSLCEVMWFGITAPTSNAIPSLVARLLEETVAVEAIRRRPADAPGFVAEVLRLESPTSYVRRITADTADLAGFTIPRGKRTVLYLAAANVDPAVFPDPLTFDIGRDQSMSLAFGGGLHFCLGAAVARTILASVTRHLLQAYETLHCPEPPRRHEYEFSNMRALRRLPVVCR